MATGLQWTIARQINDRNEYDLHRPRNDSIAALNHPELTFKLTTLTNDVIWDHKPIAGKIAGQVGVSTLYQYNLMDGRPLIPNFNQFNIGIFWMERYVKNGWELEAGVRYDYRTLKTYRIVNREKVADNFTFSNFSGTLGATRNFSEHFSARLNVGTAWRAPNVSELVQRRRSSRRGRLRKRRCHIATRKSNQYHCKRQIFQTRKWTLEVGGYYNFISDFIYLKPQPEPILTIRGAFPYFKYTQTDATFKGIDVSGELGIYQAYYLIQQAQLSAGIRSERNDNYLVMIPPNRMDNQLKYELPEARQMA